jgi:signal transduction histidine kinase/ligand-binding sensor domain-containing protein
MVTRSLFFAIVPVLLWADSPTKPDIHEAGLPFLRNYSPQEYGAQTQNWAVTQDPSGIIYVGNNDGVLVYDGIRWQTFRVANGAAVRSLDVDKNGTVYVGARGEFGYLAAYESGALHYVSLLDRVPAGDRVFKDVWRTIATPDGVVFNSNERMFRWQPKTGMKVWKPVTRFFRAYSAGNELYVVSPSGLLRLDDDSFRPVPFGERFASDRIYCVTTHNGTLLVGSPKGIFLRESGSFKPYPTEADELLAKAAPYSCATLPGGGLVVTTIRGGAVLLTKEGKLERVLNENTGLSSDSVTSAYPDREGGLWLTLVAGVTRVAAQAPLSFFDERAGLTGLVTAIARHQGSLYASTNTGLYRLKASNGEFAHFEPVKGIKDAVYSLLSTKTGLLAGSASGVYQLSEGQPRFIRDSQKAAYDLSLSSQDPTLIFVGGPEGLALLRERGGHWSDGGKVPGIQQALRKVTPGPGLWFGTEYQGALRMEGLSDSPAIEAFEAKHGLPAGTVFPYVVSGRIVFLTTGGILTFDPKSRRFLPDPALAPLFAGRADQPTVLAEDPDQKNIWIGAKTYGGLLRRQADGSYHLDESPLRLMGVSEIFTIHVDADGATWAGTADGIVRYNPAVTKNYAVPFSALVRRVSDIEGTRIHFAGAGQPKERTLPYEGNSLRFQFAAPTFDDESRTEYRVFLAGFDRNWSAWSQETRKDYTNLPEGHYAFRVEARNLYGVTGQPGAYTFTVLPPWYRTWWGYGLRVLAIAVLVWFVVRWRLRQLAEQNRRLQKIVEDRTAELREKNLALTEANDTLNQLNSEKNEFMGIAAHDLKNPLGAIRGYAEMLEEDAGSMPADEVVDTAGRIKKSANLMFDLVSNLLDVNRIEQGKMDLTLKPCDLWDTVRQAVEGYRPRALAKQIRLHFDEQNRPPLVRADPSQLVQIMDNLVSNAVKYSPKGKTVYVRVHQLDGRVRAEVKDEGPGISAEDQKRLFGKFARLSARPTAGEHSTGLGLAIVKRLVESMQGKVWCESEAGKGAAFIVELPLASERVPDPPGVGSIAI